MAQKQPPKTTVSKPARAGSKPRAPKAGPLQPAETLSELIRTSVAAASWLNATDRAAVELALTLARTIEGMQVSAEGIQGAAPAFTVLARLLNDLGLTSKGRPDLAAPIEGVSWLDDIRKNAIRKH